MFSNACIYNDPDSQIYKDALTLQRGMIRKKVELVGEETTNVPDVQFLVRGLLYALHSNVMNFRDEEGRCYSDSLVELLVEPDASLPDEQKRKTLSLPIIGKLLKLGLYRRLDCLQEDMFAVFQKARQEKRTDSEMYEDACELQIYFLEERDRLCKDGLRLASPALNHTKASIQREIDSERKEKQETERLDDAQQIEEDKKNNKRPSKMTVEIQPEEAELTYTKTTHFDDTDFKVGDYVYIRPEEANKKPHIVSIERLWVHKNGLQGLYGCWFFRPEETFHLASRKFLEKEVFRSHRSSHIMLEGVIKKCFVMNVKEYFRLKPEGYDNEDIWVCESRYNGKTKSFKKIKSLHSAVPHVNLIPREEVLTAKRVPSVFSSNGVDARKDRLLDDSAPEVTSLEGFEFDRIKQVCRGWIFLL